MSLGNVGRKVRPMSFGTAVALDCVPKSQLMKALEEAEIDARARRVAHFWLRDRVSQVEMETADGVIRSLEDYRKAGPSPRYCGSSTLIRW